MEKDCHYYVMYFMCLMAGLEEEEAYEIAYCSQYVDDSTDGRQKIMIDREGNRYYYDPVRSAHNGFESIGIEVQEKIYYPFHFLPGMQGESFDEQMVTRPGEDGKLFKKIIEEALKSSDHIRIGISLHALADTFAHTNFSGMWTWSNDVSRVNYIPAGTNSFLNLLGKIRWHFRRGMFAAAPPIGHSNAFTFPDAPYLNWKYFDYVGDLVLVSNSIKFVSGFLDLYEMLIGKYAEKKKKSPRMGGVHNRKNEALRRRLWKGVHFCGNLEKRCENWKIIIRDFAAEFNKEIDEKISKAKAQGKKDELKKQKLTLPDNHLNYDKHEWQESVLRQLAGNKMKLKVSIEDFQASPLYRFHVQARVHRALVLELINNPEMVGVDAAAGESMISDETIAYTKAKKLLKKI